MVQRYLSVRSVAAARLSIWLSGLAITVILSVVAYAGLVIFTRYINCDPVTSGLVATKDQVLFYFQQYRFCIQSQLLIFSCYRSS